MPYVPAAGTSAVRLRKAPSLRCEIVATPAQLPSARAIVIHPAWYVNQSLIQDQGKIGRSQGCFAFAKEDISAVLERVPAGCLLYADKV